MRGDREKNGVRGQLATAGDAKPAIFTPHPSLGKRKKFAWPRVLAWTPVMPDSQARCNQAFQSTGAGYTFKTPFNRRAYASLRSAHSTESSSQPRRCRARSTQAVCAHPFRAIDLRRMS
jgi:hypothetical protein